jgi:hypothetical protein
MAAALAAHANKVNSELLDFVLAAEVWQGLHEDHDHDCWAKELLAGLMFVDPNKDRRPTCSSCCHLRTREAWLGWLSKQILIEVCW